jgi:hypothetical protein
MWRISHPHAAQRRVAQRRAQLFPPTDRVTVGKNAASGAGSGVFRRRSAPYPAFGLTDRGVYFSNEE